MTDEAKPKGRRGAHFTPEFQKWAQSHRTHESLSYAQSCRTSESLSEAGRKGFERVEELYGPGFAVSAANKGGREYRKEHDSWPELIMKGLLKRLKIGFRREWPIPESDLSADFFLPETKQVIEVNSIWHNQPDQQERDERKQALLKERGIPCLVIWDREILDPDPEKARAMTDRIRQFVTQEREQQKTPEQSTERSRKRTRSLGIERRAKPLVDTLPMDSQLMLTAIHEAGHAVCDTLHGFRVRKVTIKPSRGAAGRCIGEHIIPKERLREKIRGFYAGYLAEVLFHPNEADHETAQPDFEEAEELLSLLFPGQDITDEALAVYDETAAILSTEANLRAIRLVAECLYIRTTISGQRVREIVSLTREADGGGR